MPKNIEDFESKIRYFFRHLFSIIQAFPYISAIVFFLIVFVLSASSGNLAKAFAAIGTISAVIWALYHQEIKHYLDRPNLQIENINLDYPYFRPVEHSLFDIDYYINIPLINNGKRTATNCTPILYSIYENKSDDKWEKIQNWIPLPLQWAADEREFEDVIIEGETQTVKRKIARAERNIVPNRPYFFNLGMFDVGKSIVNLCQFVLLTFPQLKAQTNSYSEGHFCYQVKIIAEEIEPLIKYFYLKWCWPDCKIAPSTKPKIIIWEIKDNPP
ncbi:MAG: hypothetical protein AB1424_11610 [Thermodesulfobacteriota bacterium]